VLALLVAVPAALASLPRANGVYATSKFRTSFVVNPNGTALRNAGLSCTKKSVREGSPNVFVFFGNGKGEIGHGRGAIDHHGVFSYSGPALTPGGGPKVHFSFSGRFVSKNKAVGVTKSPACLHGKRVHFTALYRGK
jgi:hypothetical protein